MMLNDGSGGTPATVPKVLSLLAFVTRHFFLSPNVFLTFLFLFWPLSFRQCGAHPSGHRRSP